MKILMLVGIAFAIGLGGKNAQASDPVSVGEVLFTQHCARCHTTAGVGLAESSPLAQNFEALPADLTDSLFSSQEPRGDWFLVIKYGGAAMGLSEKMPAHEQRLDDEEIESVLDYVKTFADTRPYPPGDLNLLRPFSVIKPFPETEFLALTRAEVGTESDIDWRHTLYYAHRLGARLQGEIKSSLTQGGAGTSLSDLEVGLKWSIFNWKSLLLVAIGAEVEVPFSAPENSEVIGYASHASTLGDAFTLQGTVRAIAPFADDDGNKLRLSEVVHWLPRPWPGGVFLGLEAIATTRIDGVGKAELSVIPQLIASLSKRGHVSLHFGVEVPMRGLDYDFRAHAFLRWDIVDGPFWEGW